MIVPAFNEEAKIGGSIRSLIEQETNVSYEIIVVDSSFDDTANIIRKEFPTVVLISSYHRLSCGEAKNVGLEVRARKQDPVYRCGHQSSRGLDREDGEPSR